MSGRAIRLGMSVVVAVAIATVMWPAARAAGAAGAAPLHVTCTTFPLYLLTKNVVGQSTSVGVDLMLPADMGCPHDYTLTPQDMRKLAASDVLVINGLGLEEFLGAPIRRANPTLKIVDTSAGVSGVLGEESGHGHAGHDHAHGNPHLFGSPRMAARLALNIGRELARLDPAGAAAYSANARAHAAALDALAAEFAALGKRLANPRIVTQHEVFDYLARDMGLEIAAVIQSEPGQEPSAAEMLELVKVVRTRRVGGVFTEPQYPVRIPQVIAKEAGVRAATLDPVATGPANAPLDYYLTTMRQNLKTLAEVLGTK